MCEVFKEHIETQYTAETSLREVFAVVLLLHEPAVRVDHDLLRKS